MMFVKLCIYLDFLLLCNIIIIVCTTFLNHFFYFFYFLPLFIYFLKLDIVRKLFIFNLTYLISIFSLLPIVVNTPDSYCLRNVVSQK